MKSTNIKIFKNNFEKLKEIEGSTMDARLNILMNNVEKIAPFVEYTDEKTSIKTNQDTLDRLDSFRITLNESRDNIITRLLILLDEINNTAVEEWISFKLVNPYNNLLVIEGQLEYNSREISFNYRGNVYYHKLPANYIVNGKDLTKELYLWYDNLNWHEIINLLIENVDKQTLIENKYYSLEINNVFG